MINPNRWAGCTEHGHLRRRVANGVPARGSTFTFGRRVAAAEGDARGGGGMDASLRGAGVGLAAGVMSGAGSPAAHPELVTIRHTLSARFVEIDGASVEEFEHHGVAIRVDARVRESHSFATIVCTGSVEIDDAADLVDNGGYLPIFVRDGRSEESLPLVRRAWSQVEPVVQEVGAVLRWRFGMFGDDPLWTSTQVIVETHGEVIELEPMPEMMMGDDMAHIGGDELGQIAELVVAGATQPLAHEMWREAWNLRHSSPRSSLVVGVAAAEVGFKQLVALLVPEAASLVEHIPSPPLDTMIRKVLPDLPLRSGFPAESPCPQHLRKALIAAVEGRNLVVHRGTMPQLFLRGSLLDIRDFLYLLDYHAGHGWAEELLSQQTRDTIHAR